MILLVKKLLVKHCKIITGGGLQKGNSKMPSLTYGISAKQCKTGAKLARVKGSTCQECYALKGNYRFPQVAKGLFKRGLSVHNSRWVEAMTILIKRQVKTDNTGKKYFRWHDSEDIKSSEHFENIIQVARNCSDVLFWLPTREYQTLRQYKGVVPGNICVRVSAYMIGAKPPKNIPTWATTSTVSYEGADLTCPAPEQDGACQDCRRCWDNEIKNTNYIQH